jgi:hypothetical protein
MIFAIVLPIKRAGYPSFFLIQNGLGEKCFKDSGPAILRKLFVLKNQGDVSISLIVDYLEWKIVVFF